MILAGKRSSRSLQGYRKACSCGGLGASAAVCAAPFKPIEPPSNNLQGHVRVALKSALSPNSYRSTREN